MATNNQKPFWKFKQLHDMTPEEWESLCDGCGICCLYKLEDEETGEILYTNVACRLLNPNTCRCTDYEHRTKEMPTCLNLTPRLVPKLKWLPSTCAYRRIANGEDLYAWHPLISGNPDAAHFAGISVRGKTIPESTVNLNDLEDFIIDWIE
jgi:uncharacterized cysteine cluster protein YcgN (CxxCxxCC family)